MIAAALLVVLAALTAASTAASCIGLADTICDWIEGE